MAVISIHSEPNFYAILKRIVRIYVESISDSKSGQSLSPDHPHRFYI